MLPTGGVSIRPDRDNRSQEMKAQRPATYQRVWFITGSSADLGRALTEAVLARGERAVVTARTPERVRDLIERYPAQALVLELDVTRQDQVRQAVSEAIERFGRIDVLVNNAGQLFDSSVFGLVDVTRVVLPAMRRASSGHIVNILSGIPSRRAVEGFSAALADELAPLGIKVITIEPASANGHQPGDSAAVAGDIIAAVDGVK